MQNSGGTKNKESAHVSNGESVAVFMSTDLLIIFPSARVKEKIM